MRGTSARHRAREGLSLWSQIEERVWRAPARPIFTGVRLSAPDGVTAWSMARQIAGGEYDHPGLTPRPGERVIDVGANIGVFSLWAASKGATVDAYEPSPATFLHLSRNTSKRRITPIHAAVVGEAQPLGTARLYLHDERSTRNTLLGREIESGVDMSNFIEVPAIPIDAVLQNGCDLLKLDCEGGEFDIVRAASDDTLRRATRIVMEFHRTAGDPEELLSRLRGAGFTADVLSGMDVDAPFGLVGAVRR